MRKYQDSICTKFFSFISTGQHATLTDKAMSCVNGVIYSFATPIAFWHGNVLIITDKKYTKTTASQQKAILQYAEKYGVKVEHTEKEIADLQEFKMR